MADLTAWNARAPILSAEEMEQLKMEQLEVKHDGN